MKAAVYATTGPAREVLRVQELPAPEPLAGEVRVRVEYSGVNPSDVKNRAGLSSKTLRWGAVIPHSDGAGIVESLGAGVPGSWLGKRVWIFNGQWDRPHGTAAEYICLPPRQVVDLPAEVSMETGASMGIPLMTAYHAVSACGNLLGRTVLVPGAAGSVGYYATQLARLAGARVIAVVSSEHKGRLALDAGAHAVINYRSEKVGPRVRELTGGNGADAIIEVDAAANAAHYGEALAFGGKVVVYGSGKAGVEVPFRPMIMGFANLYFFIVYRLPQAALEDTLGGIAGLLARGLLRHPATAVYALEQIAEAHERVEQGADAKVLVRI